MGVADLAAVDEEQLGTKLVGVHVADGRCRRRQGRQPVSKHIVHPGAADAVHLDAGIGPRVEILYRDAGQFDAGVVAPVDLPPKACLLAGGVVVGPDVARMVLPVGDVS
jgi:hypothetical protein